MADEDGKIKGCVHCDEVQQMQKCMKCPYYEMKHDKETGGRSCKCICPCGHGV